MNLSRSKKTILFRCGINMITSKSDRQNIHTIISISKHHLFITNSPTITINFLPKQHSQFTGDQEIPLFAKLAPEKSFHFNQGYPFFITTSWTPRLPPKPVWKNLLNLSSIAFALPFPLPRLRLLNKVIILNYC